mmetsp:Transcript_4933/g.31607  ORF Transcript_4933/g.31607 Transcript_4933/m.31607 type:complete len:256 (-) Transcript_4933:35-802(-)
MVFNPITTRLTVLPYPPLPCVPRWPLVEQVSCNAFVRPISLPDKKGCVPSTASIMTVQVLDSSASLFFLALAWDGVGCLCNWTTSFSLRLFSYPSVGIDFFGVQFDHFSFVHFFGFFDSQSDGPTKVLHQHFCLLHFAGVHFASHQGCKGNLGTEFLGDSQGQGGLSCSWCTGQQQRSTGHFFLSDEIHHQSTRFSCCLLSYESATQGRGGAVFLESQSADVGVGGHALLLSMAMRRGHFFDAHHRHATRTTQHT